MKKTIRKLALGIPLAVLALGVVFGLPRLDLDVDVFNLLPTDSRMVEGLKLYQRSFGSSRELIVSVNAADADAATAAAHSLAEELRRAGLAGEVVWQSPFREDPAALSELLAYVWFNRPPGEFRRMAERFDDERMAPTVEQTLDRLTTSLKPREIGRLSRDPFALSDLPEELSSMLPGGTEDPFASPDGSFRVLFVHPPFEEGNFWDVHRWIGRIADRVATWRGLRPENASVAVRLTGDPAFMSEIGSGMLSDMRLAALGTLSIVAGLFWLAHRRWAPLVWLVSLLLFVVVATVAIGGVFLGSLNAVSLGFAAILLGLAADYGLILYQEYIADPGRSLSDHRSAIAPSILWAAATTAGAFVMISRSSLPGLTQLGALVAIGISLAAAVMLIGFLPPIARRRGAAQVTEREPEPAPLTPAVNGAARSSLAWTATVAAGVIAIALVAHRLPTVDYGTEGLGVKKGEARAAIEELHEKLGGGHEPLWVIVSGRDEREVAERMTSTRALLAEAVDEGLLGGFALPDAVWPAPDAQRDNRETARRLAGRLPRAVRVAGDHGFTDDALLLTRGVFEAWDRFADVEGVVWPTHPGSRWAFRKFASSDEDRLLALARLEVADDASNDALLALAGRLTATDGGRLFSWALLSESLLDTMRADVRHVMVPMVLMLLVILFIAFRRFHEITLSLATLGFSLLCLFAVMTILDWSWNLMNVMALPLLFGAGIDYSIHVQLALRRHAGDVARVRRTVGRAILLCGTSTAAGFGTLAFASNAGLASLGRVCATGIVIASLTSVALLPVWWRTLGFKAAEQG